MPYLLGFSKQFIELKYCIIGPHTSKTHTPLINSHRIKLYWVSNSVVNCENIIVTFLSKEVVSLRRPFCNLVGTYIPSPN